MDIRYYLAKPLRLVSALGRRGCLNWMSDRAFIRLCYKERLGVYPNLDNPRGFNEKLQWLKLHDRNPLYIKLVDKIAVKDWVSEKIGQQYVVPLIGVWGSFGAIDFDALPDRFVLKSNHDSGGVSVCKDKNTYDKKKAKALLDRHLSHSGYLFGREWPYKDVKPLVFAEEYLESDSSKGDLPDYKVMCFAGTPRLVQVHRGRFSEHVQDFYTTAWEKLDFSQGMPQSGLLEKRPGCLDEMLALSGVLSSGFPQVRVDWYVTGGGLKFGEMTLFDGSGFDAFDPPEWDERLGSWVDLSLAYGDGGRGE